MKVERRNYRRPAPLTFAAYAETWLAQGQQLGRWKPSTVAQYRSIVRRLKKHLGAIPLGAIRPRHVAAYVADACAIPLAPATVSRDLSVLHAIFKSALREELVDANPARGGRAAEGEPRRWRILEPAEVARVAKAFTDDQARAVFLTLILTGIRRYELQALRWRTSTCSTGCLRVRRSKSEAGERSIALSPTLREVLSERYRQTAYTATTTRLLPP